MAISQLLKLVNEWGIAAIENEPMSLHTTFQIGGPTRLFLTPANSIQVAEIIQFCFNQKIKYFILGRGSNLLVADEGFDGAIIEIGSAFGFMTRNGNKISCGAGVSLSRLALFAASEGLSGLEFSYGIPGSVGGAVYMNAGAYGGEMKDVVCSATHIDEYGQLNTLEATQLKMGYRHSYYSGKNHAILQAEVELCDGEPDCIKTKMDGFMAQRKAKQPLEMPSAGSTFMRPPGNFAGTLIEKCGLKGYQIGGAQVSLKHSGFIVNAGSATAKDVLDLVKHIQNVVSEKTGVFLECEIKYLT